MNEIFKDITVADLVTSYIAGKMKHDPDVSTERMKHVLSGCAKSEYDHDLFAGFLIAPELESRNIYMKTKIDSLKKVYETAFVQNALKRDENNKLVNFDRYFGAVTKFVNDIQQQVVYYAKLPNKSKDELKEEKKIKSASESIRRTYNELLLVYSKKQFALID